MQKRILIIDDSDLIRNCLINSISDMADVTVTGQATNIRDGYILFNSLNPDIIILDIHLQGESGLKLLERIKQESPDTVVIMMTSYPYEAYRLQCEKLGADFFLDKGTEFEKISQLIGG